MCEGYTSVFYHGVGNTCIHAPKTHSLHLWNLLYKMRYFQFLKEWEDQHLNATSGVSLSSIYLDNSLCLYIWILNNKNLVTKKGRPRKMIERTERLRWNRTTRKRPC